MRGCLTAQSERFTRASLTIGQDGRVVAIKTGGEEGGDTGLVDGRLEREGGGERERERERGGKDLIIWHLTMLYYVIVCVPIPE